MRPMKGLSTVEHPYAVVEVPASDIHQKPETSLSIFGGIGCLALVVAALSGLWSLFFGGWLWLVALLVYAAMWPFAWQAEKAEKERALQTLQAQQTQSYTKQLNSLVVRSTEIAEEILPAYEQKARDALAAAREAFETNGIYSFWEHVQEASKSLACYKEALNQLGANGELYTAVLASKKHTFPASLPALSSVHAPAETLNDYEAVVQMALSGKDIARVHQFTNIWLQMKTNQILIAGFTTLEQTIRNVGMDIVGSIADLQRSVDRGFAEVNERLRAGLKSFEESQRLLNESLNSMDTKLYYIQYRQTPRARFVHRT